jgi:hypothetical protein
VDLFEMDQGLGLVVPHGESGGNSLGEYRCASPFCHAVLINHGITCSRSESKSLARRDASRSKKVRLIT